MKHWPNLLFYILSTELTKSIVTLSAENVNLVDNSSLQFYYIDCRISRLEVFKMNELNDLDVIDLISERHVMLRKVCEQLWNDRSELPISNSEWYIMARIYRRKPTISQIARQVDISRQAAHKLINKMEIKGLVKLTKSNNNKDKCVQLTELGEECYEKNKLLKASLEKKIAEKIGTEQLSFLKDILKSDWEIKSSDGS
jgi:DNA-binding MarR family transcriptional regulator